MSSGSPFADLAANGPWIAPSLLACDFGRLNEEIARAEEAGVRILHLDVMDGRFVPNISFGFPILDAARRATRLPLDVHLMIEEPDRYIDRFCDAGADALTIHIECSPDPGDILSRIRQRGVAAGLSLNPPTPVAALESHLDDCDQVLVMSVMPGFGGQEFDAAALGKLRRLRGLRPTGLVLSIDGGINEETIGATAEAGADLLVAGTAFFGYPDYQERHVRLGELARNGRQPGKEGQGMTAG